MWNINKIRKLIDLLQYNLIYHPLKNKTIKFRGENYKILNIFKEWNNGWFLSMEIIHTEGKFQDRYIKIPFENINSINPDIIEKIEIVKKQIQI